MCMLLGGMHSSCAICWSVSYLTDQQIAHPQSTEPSGQQEGACMFKEKQGMQGRCSSKSWVSNLRPSSCCKTTSLIMPLPLGAMLATVQGTSLAMPHGTFLSATAGGPQVGHPFSLTALFLTWPKNLIQSTWKIPTYGSIFGWSNQVINLLR